MPECSLNVLRHARYIFCRTPSSATAFRVAAQNEIRGSEGAAGAQAADVTERLAKRALRQQLRRKAVNCSVRFGNFVFMEQILE